LDLHENVEANTVTATFELPGLTKENVDIHVHDGRLYVSGESKISAEHEESGYAIRERRYGKFSRTLQLPYGVKVSKTYFLEWRTRLLTYGTGGTGQCKDGQWNFDSNLPQVHA